MILTQRFDDAFRYAHRLHLRQQRKGSSIPYISHLMTVAALVLENEGDEEQAIAALLHDAAEDQGGASTLAEIRVLFGNVVWDRFNGGADGTRWYYRALVEVFSNAIPGRLSGRLSRAVAGFST